MMTSNHSSADGPRFRIGLIEDDPIMGESLMQRFKLEGYHVSWWNTGEKALASFRSAACQILVCDIRLPDLDGEQLFRQALPDLGTTPVIFITAFSNVEQVVRLMRAGADDYVSKPFDVEELLQKIKVLCMRETPSFGDTLDRQVLGWSPAMRSIESELQRIKDSSTPVLFLGETGVGKEVAARHLHDTSARRESPFIVVSCATLPKERAEDTLFGHESDASQHPNGQSGLIEQAEDGTLFLDEVSALSPTLQGKFLRVLEDGSFRKIGGTRTLVSKARIVSSSNANLGELVACNGFRPDLYYRLNAVEFHIPPLRERPDDIVPLAEHIIVEIARRNGHRIPSMNPSAHVALREHSWPGNIRELRNRLERAMALSADRAQLSAHVLFPEHGLLASSEGRISSLAEARDRAERIQIEAVLHQTRGEVGKAAILLGISRTTLWEKMRRLKIS